MDAKINANIYLCEITNMNKFIVAIYIVVTLSVLAALGYAIYDWVMNDDFTSDPSCSGQYPSAYTCDEGCRRNFCNAESISRRQKIALNPFYLPFSESPYVDLDETTPCPYTYTDFNGGLLGNTTMASIPDHDVPLGAEDAEDAGEYEEETDE